MRIKSIKPTNRYKYVRLHEYINYDGPKEVLTPSGWQPVLDFQKIKRGPTIRIYAGKRYVRCDPEHILLTNNGPKKAIELDCDNDKLITYYGKELNFYIRNSREDDLYDIQIPDPHWWYTGGLISHNSLLLCNNAFSSVRNGLNVLLITFELSSIKTGMRILGAMSGYNLDSFTLTNTNDLTQEEIQKIVQYQDNIRAKAAKYSKRGQIVLYELPPDECSVDNIYSIIESNKKSHGWTPNVVITDYLDLMISRRASMNNGDYERQKSIATEIRGLAKNENVLVYTATQTNRSGMNVREGNKKQNRDPGNIDLDKSAESFGKTMPVDYVVSLNQTEAEYNRNSNGDLPSIIRLWVAKNRNGPKFVSITTNVWYNRMQISEMQ